MSPQQKVKEILYHIQILNQNDEITPEAKNEIVAMLSEARKTDDFSKLNKRFRAMSYGITMQDTIDSLIAITAQNT